MKILLDTNAYSALRRGHETVAQHVRSSEQLLMSLVVIGELLYGFRHGSRYVENVRALEDFLADPDVRLLPVTRQTADHFGRISAELRKAGNPIPTNDVWIAAQAVENEVELLSSDSHFRGVAGLSWRSFLPL